MVSKSKRKRLAAEKQQQVTRVTTVTVPKPGPRPKRQSAGRSGTGKTTVLSGVDLLGSTEVKDTNKTGEPLLEFVINPQSLPQTRLAQLAELWVRWRPKSLKLECLTTSSIMTGGGFVVGWSADTSDKLASAGLDNIRHIVMLDCQQQCVLTGSFTLNIPTGTAAKWYTFRGTPMESAHGILLAALTGPIVTKTATVTWKLHWQIEFEGPDAPRQSEVETIEPAVGWSPVFTDSVSDWESGKYLTFKHSEGGAVVPWTGVRPNVIYVPDGDTQVTVYKADGTEAVVGFFSAMKSTEYPTAVVPHASELDAQNYQKTGSKSYLLPYTKAGNWCTPQRPRLKASKIISSKVALSNLPDSPVRDVVRTPMTSDSRIAALEDKVKELTHAVNRLIMYSSTRVDVPPPNPEDSGVSSPQD